MSKLRATWELPTTRVDGSAVTPADIDHVHVVATLDGATFDDGAISPSVPQEFIVDTPAPGLWVITLTAAPKKGATSDAASASLDVPFAQLSVVVNPMIALE